MRHTAARRSLSQPASAPSPQGPRPSAARPRRLSMECRARHLCPQSPLPPFSCGATTGTRLAPLSGLCPVSCGKALLPPTGAPPPPLPGRTRMGLWRHPYLSLGVSWQRRMSGTEVTPQRLYCPSPMERDTSSTPRTRPSLKRGTNVQAPLARPRVGHGGGWGRGKGWPADAPRQPAAPTAPGRRHSKPPGLRGGTAPSVALGAPRAARGRLR